MYISQFSNTLNTYLKAIVCIPLGVSLLIQTPVQANQLTPTTNSIPTVSYTDGERQVQVPDWSQITWGNLPAIEQPGWIQVPAKFARQLGYDPSRVWVSGNRPAQFVMLGDAQDAFHLEAFNLNDISGLSGLAMKTLNLNDFGLMQWQTPKSLVKAIPQLGNLPVNRVAPIAYLWQLSGGWGNGSINSLIQQNPNFGNLPLGELDLRRYSLQSIPGVAQTPLSKFKGWQQSFIAQVPGLSYVPFDRFPVPLVNGSISVAIADVAWSDAERGDPKVPPNLYISGTVNRKDLTVPVPCIASKPYSYVELSDPVGANGAMHGKRWVSGKSQKVKGGFGPLKIINGGWEPTGIAVYPKAPFKVVLTDVDETNGTAKLALFFHACGTVSFQRSCSPRFIGPVPWGSVQEKGFVIVAATAKPNVNIPSKYRKRIAQIKQQYKEQQEVTDSNELPSSATASNTQTTPSSPKSGRANASIVSAIELLGSFPSNVPGTDGGQNACMWAVNRVLKEAGYAPLGNDTLAVGIGQADLESGRGTKINIANAQPGDIVLVDKGGSHQHIGFCVNNGCTRTISNSSSRASFSFRGNSNFSYPGSPYNGATPQIYRLNK